MVVTGSGWKKTSLTSATRTTKPGGDATDEAMPGHRRGRGLVLATGRIGRRKIETSFLQRPLGLFVPINVGDDGVFQIIVRWVRMPGCAASNAGCVVDRAIRRS